MRNITVKDDLGKVNYNIDIVRDIVVCAVSEVKGVCPLVDINTKNKKAVRITADDNHVYVEVFVKVLYNVAGNEVSADLQKSIKTAIETNTQYVVSNIDVHIVGIQFADSY